MSVNYADALSPYTNKGRVGMKEYLDDGIKLAAKVKALAKVVRNSRHTVVIVGAGISTAAGIPDFRGPEGVWTLEKKGLKPATNVADFSCARPTFTHRALVALQKAGLVHFVVSQNIDGLLHRAGFPLNRLADVHGNVFVEHCPMCRTAFVRRRSVVPTMTLKPTGRKCDRLRVVGSRTDVPCRGFLRDTVLDWDDALPEPELSLAVQHCRQATVCLCLGTSLQIFPVAGFPGLTKRNGGSVGVVNLQRTRCDALADTRLFAKVDDVMTRLVELLNVDVPTVDSEIAVVKSSSPLDDQLSSIPLISRNFVINDDI